jgi:hypothetical protein
MEKKHFPDFEVEVSGELWELGEASGVEGPDAERSGTMTLT